MGLPGAGKTTLASTLAAHSSGQHLSAGQWLRDRMAAGDQAAAEQLRASTTMNRPLFLRFLRESLARQPSHQDLLIIDGAPRTPAQVSWLREALADGDATVFGVHLDLPSATAMQRLASRAPRHGDGAAADPARRIAAEEPGLWLTLTAFGKHWPLLTVSAGECQANVMNAVMSAVSSRRAIPSS